MSVVVPSWQCAFPKKPHLKALFQLPTKNLPTETEIGRLNGSFSQKLLDLQPSNELSWYFTRAGHKFLPLQSCLSCNKNAVHLHRSGLPSAGRNCLKEGKWAKFPSPYWHKWRVQQGGCKWSLSSIVRHLFPPFVTTECSIYWWSSHRTSSQYLTCPRINTLYFSCT